MWDGLPWPCPDAPASNHPEQVCLLTKPHEAHDWVYTSSGGGHMMDTWDDTGYERNQKWWHCPGTPAGDDQREALAQQIRWDITHRCCAARHAGTWGRSYDLDPTLCHACAETIEQVVALLAARPSAPSVAHTVTVEWGDHGGVSYQFRCNAPAEALCHAVYTCECDEWTDGGVENGRPWHSSVRYDDADVEHEDRHYGTLDPDECGQRDWFENSDEVLRGSVTFPVTGTYETGGGCTFEVAGTPAPTVTTEQAWDEGFATGVDYARGAEDQIVNPYSQK